ncbi:MAG: DUF1971 domain-containing protein [Sphingomonadaceae bacterium]
MSEPYRSTPVFDASSLPAALQRKHRTKPGVWGVIRILEGTVDLTFADGTPDKRLTPDNPGLILPDQAHWVTPQGDFRMRIDFYDAPPVLPNGD